jgi:hypothetical protein
VPNRRSWDEALTRELTRAARSGDTVDPARPDVLGRARRVDGRETADELLRRADKALHEANESGRDRLFLAQNVTLAG